MTAPAQFHPTILPSSSSSLASHGWDHLTRTGPWAQTKGKGYPQPQCMPQQGFHRRTLPTEYRQSEKVGRPSPNMGAKTMPQPPCFAPEWTLCAPLLRQGVQQGQGKVFLPSRPRFWGVMRAGGRARVEEHRAEWSSGLDTRTLEITLIPTLNPTPFWCRGWG